MRNCQVQAVQLNVSSETCEVCGSTRFLVEPLNDERFCLRRCQECGTAWTYPKSSREELDSHYSESYYGPENVKFISILEKIVGWAANKRAKWMNGKIGDHSKILEIGCGRGLLLSSLAGLGHECHGTERSKLAARRAQKVPGLEIHTAPLDECSFQTNYFDLVILWHVLEHLDNPAHTLGRLCQLLRPGGILILEVPNLTSLQSRLTGKRWFHLDIERHLYHFPVGGLKRLLNANGFAVIEESTFSWEQCPFGVLQSFLNCLGLGPDTLYKLLKREISPTLPLKLLHYSLAATLVFPAILFAALESVLRRGGVIRIVARKSLNLNT